MSRAPLASERGALNVEPGRNTSKPASELVLEDDQMERNTVGLRRKRGRLLLSMPPSQRLPRFLKTLGWSTLLALCLVIMVQQVLAFSQQQTDFCQDYLVAQRLLQGIPIYQPLHCWAGILPIPTPREYDTHPPFAALAFFPFGLLPLGLATALWGVGCLLAYLASGFLLLGELGWRSLRGLALFVAGSSLWSPFLLSERFLNFTQLLLLLIVVGWWLERRGHHRWAGGLLGLAGLLKVWPVALLLGAIGRRQWRLAVVGGLTLVIGSGIALLVLGLGAYLAYVGPVAANEQGWVPDPANSSLVGAVARPLSSYPVVHLSPLISGIPLKTAVLLGEGAAALLGVATLAFLWWSSRRATGEAAHLLEHGLLVTLLLLVFPLSWYPGLILLLFPTTTTLLALRQLPRPPRWWWALLVVSLLALAITQLWTESLAEVLLALPNVFLRAFGILWFGCQTYALLLFGALQAWLLWHLCRADEQSTRHGVALEEAHA